MGGHVVSPQTPFPRVYPTASGWGIKNHNKKYFTNKVDAFAFAYPVGKKVGVTAELDILMLAPGTPGNIIFNGDIDNRLKTLFDALRCPKNINLPPLFNYN